ncbi:MAG: DUF3494 domain-containing protein [Bdellovibrio sp.]|nr:DUF3494 domain-containing protein [Bdellovibrio sp.]
MKKLKVCETIFKKAAGVAFLILPITVFLGCSKGGSGASFPAATSAGVGTGLGGAGRGPAPVNLNSAGNYIILAQSAITDVPTSAITGNVGLSPATGAGIGIACVEITGVVQSVDAAGPAPCVVTAPVTLTAAIGDKGTAYTDAAGRAPDYTELATGLIGGLNLGPATYRWSTAVSILSTLKLTGGPNDVWIFQIAQGLSIASGTQIILEGGALPQNIYWQVFSAADLGTTSVFKGTIISQTAIVMKTGASINGRLLAGTGVTLDQNSISP